MIREDGNEWTYWRMLPATRFHARPSIRLLHPIPDIETGIRYSCTVSTLWSSTLRLNEKFEQKTWIKGVRLFFSKSTSSWFSQSEEQIWFSNTSSIMNIIFPAILATSLLVVYMNAAPFGETSNNMSSEQMDQVPANCITKVDSAVDCKELLPRYQYHADSNTCSQFMYGGCGRDSNNFATKDACVVNCVRPVSWNIICLKIN